MVFWRVKCVPCHLVTALVLMSSQGCGSKYSVRSSIYAGLEGEINQHTRLIHAPKSQVFQILTQEEAFKSVCPENILVTRESPPPYQVGTLIRTRVFEKFELEWNARVEEVIPEERIRLTFLDGFFAGGAELWELENEKSATRVTHTIVVQPKGVLKKLAWILKVRGKHDAMVEAFLDNLKQAAEKSD